MKFKISLFLTAALFLTSCGSPDSSHNTNSGNAQAKGLRTEKITCNGRFLVNYKQKDGSDNKELSEWVTITSRNLTPSSDGRSVIADTSGETTQNTYQYFNDSTKTFLSKFSYTYTAHRNSETTTLPDGTIKDISRVSTRKIGKDGSQFPDGNGGKTDSVESEHTYESITRIDGDRTYDISIKIDGKAQPVHDYVNTSRTDNGVKTDRTTLTAPFSEMDQYGETITEVDDSICRTEIVK